MVECEVWPAQRHAAVASLVRTASCRALRPSSPPPPRCAHPTSPHNQACGAQAHLVFSSVTGAAREPASELWLHGTEGTLHLDLDSGLLALALKSGERILGSSAM